MIEEKDLNELKEKFDNETEKRLLAISQASNIIGHKAFRKMALSVMGSINDVISATIGPFGSNNMIHPIYSGKVAYFNKDGRDNIHNIIYSSGNPIPTSIMSLVKDVSNYVQFKIGDGTSSGIPIITEMYKQLYTNLLSNSDLNISPSGFSVVLNEILEHFEKHLFQNPLYYKKIDIMDDTKFEDIKKLLRKVGTIAGNYDKQAADMIAELYDSEVKSLYPSVNIVEGFGEKDEIMKQTGFELNQGMIESQTFKNNNTKFTFEAEDVKYLIFDGPLLSDKDVKHLNKMVFAFNTGKLMNTDVPIKDEDGNPIKPCSVVIIATEFGPDVIKWGMNNVQGLLKSVWDPTTGKSEAYKASMVLIPGGHNTQFGVMPINDLKIAVGAEFFNSNNSELAFEECLDDPDRFYEVIYKKLAGYSKKVECSAMKTVVYDGDGNQEEVMTQIKNIEQQMQQIMVAGANYTDEQLFVHRTRCDLLKSNLSRIKVGGRNVRERKAKMAFYDDIVRSIKSTIRDGGITLGGNLSIAHYIKHNKDFIIQSISDSIIDNKKNVVLGRKKEKLTDIISTILDCVSYSFCSGYRAALNNAFEDENESNSVIDDCLKDKDKFTVYNLVSDTFDSLEDLDNCNLVVPSSIDNVLMIIIFTTIRQLISTKFYLAGYSMDVEDFGELLNEEAKRRNIILNEEEE